MIQQAYLEHLQALLPQGKAWPRSQDALLTQLLNALAESLVKFDADCDVLFDELDAGKATALLPEWESATGLPGECIPLTHDLAARRKAAKARLKGRGGQSIAYFTAVAASLGYYIEIEETRPFAIGSLAGENLWAGLRVLPLKVGQPIGLLAVFDAQAPFVWYVHALRSTMRIFSIGSVVGDALRAWGNTLLECVINKDAPAHTRPLFVYDINQIPAVNTYLRAGDRAGAVLHTWSGPYTYQRSI